MEGENTPHTPCVIKQPMNSYGFLLVSEVTGSRTYHVVEYATPKVRETLSDVDRGSAVRVWLEPVASRGDAWKVVEIRERTEISREIFTKMIPLANWLCVFAR